MHTHKFHLDVLDDIKYIFFISRRKKIMEQYVACHPYQDNIYRIQTKILPRFQVSMNYNIWFIVKIGHPSTNNITKYICQHNDQIQCSFMLADVFRLPMLFSQCQKITGCSEIGSVIHQETFLRESSYPPPSTTSKKTNQFPEVRNNENFNPFLSQFVNSVHSHCSLIHAYFQTNKKSGLAFQVLLIHYTCKL